MYRCRSSLCIHDNGVNEDRWGYDGHIEDKLIIEPRLPLYIHIKLSSLKLSLLLGNSMKVLLPWHEYAVRMLLWRTGSRYLRWVALGDLSVGGVSFL